MQRAPSVPLITNDPYFSVWSPADRLYDSPTQNWTGKVQRINGNVLIDGQLYRFMGDEGAANTLAQTDLKITATSTQYQFEGGGIALRVTFLSPLLLTDPELFSRPCTYLTFAVRACDGQTHEVKIVVDCSQAHCQFGDTPEKMITDGHHFAAYDCAFMGKAKQSPLNHSGDMVSIDWGYLYLAVPSAYEGNVYSLHNKAQRIKGISPQYELHRGAQEEYYLVATLDISSVDSGEKSMYLIAAYDDIASINYFGQTKKACWADGGETITDVLQKCVAEYDALVERCGALDREIAAKARQIAGDEYAFICSLAYRQSIAAHKLMKDDDGNLVFLSKECNSNGCIATADVSYPSIPLYLLFNPELVRGMLRPIFRFAKTAAWTFAFAPHDAGRYPYATGQVYGMNPMTHHGQPQSIDADEVFPFLCQYPANNTLYKFADQMPLEECGNMLIMTAITTLCDGNTELASENLDVLETWANYLVDNGTAPGEQLCTDDFAGHLAQNANLSVKAIMGIMAFSIILQSLGKQEKSQTYADIARRYAQEWERKTAGSDHTPLTFDNRDSWGQKYNLVWDLIFGTGLFSKALYETEIRYYLKAQNAYGLPLDSRSDYTKSDWILWCTALADRDEDAEQLIKPVYAYLRDTPDRVPFSDWYFTSSARFKGFMNRTVQGGLFMPMFKKAFLSSHAPKQLR